MFQDVSTPPASDGANALAAPQTAPARVPLAALPSTQTSSLERYLAQIADPTLRENLSREIAGMGRTFGLVFERHHPEGIRLPKHQVKRGSKVIINTVKNSGYYRVARLAKDDGTAVLVDDEGNEAIYPVDQLTVAKEFGDVMYPGLRKLSEVRNGAPDAPVHTIINGENYHALEALQYTHSGKVDLIYIDPPYNTGNSDWKYNDRYIDSKDGYRHSKWLSFMEKRLLLARRLLSAKGVIFISIGHDEQHRLRMVCDAVFGEGNFITSAARAQKAGSAKGNFFAPSMDHLLVYARNKDSLPGFSQPVDPSFYNKFNLLDEGGRYTLKGLFQSSLDPRPNQRYFIECPDGSLVIPPGDAMPNVAADGEKVSPRTSRDRVWRWSRDRYLEEIPNLVFKETKTSPLIDEYGNRSKWSVYTKQYMVQDKGVLPRDFIDGFYNAQGTTTLKEIGVEFPFSKPVSLIKHIAQIVNQPSAVILDFFGGSGTTAEAVIRLNAEDGGTRQAILVTNNELSKKDDVALRKAGHLPGDAEYEALGVFQHVTKPRLETVITGTRQDGTTYSEGLAANAAFFELTYLEEPEIVTGRALEDLAGLFWLKAGGAGGNVDIDAAAKRDGYAISESGAAAILFTPGRARALAEQLKATGQVIKHLFIVTDSEAAGEEAASHFPLGINVERIYGSYLEAFQVNRKD